MSYELEPSAAVVRDSSGHRWLHLDDNLWACADCDDPPLTWTWDEICRDAIGELEEDEPA